MNLSTFHLLLLGLLFLIFIGGVYLFLIIPSEELKIYDLKTLEQEPVSLPPTTAKEAMSTAFSLDEVKSKMTEEHQVFERHFSAYSNKKFYWIATAKRTSLPQTQNNQWHVMFEARVLPDYICDISFTDTGILLGEAEIVCGYDDIK